jgi:site-specific DNA recombinase
MKTAKKLNSKPVYKIALYIRASTEEQGSIKNPEGTIKNQEMRLKRAIEARNTDVYFGEVVEVFIDDGISAKDTKRPELQRMLKAIENKEINMIMLTEYSRLSRNMRDFAQMWELFKDFDCGLISLREQFDTSSAAGEMMLYNMANLAQFERRLTSERIISSRFDRASRGLFNGGVIPLGYQSAENKKGYLEIDNDEAKTIKEAFRAFLREQSVSRAAKWLNDSGYIPVRLIKGGGNKVRVGHFTVGNLRCILTNKSYIGVLKYKRDNETFEAKAVWPAIIDKTTFNEVQKMIKNNHRRKKPMSKNRYPYTLSGLVFCSVCADVMCGKSAHGRGGKVGYYEHSWAGRKNSTLTEKALDCGMFKRVPAKKLEPLIHKFIFKLISNQEFAQELITEAQKIHKENDSAKAQLRSLKKEITSYNAQTDSLAERIAKLPVSVPVEPLYKMLIKLQEQKEEAEIKLRELSSTQGIGIDMPSEINDYQKFTSMFESLWSSESLESSDIKSRIIKKLIAKIEITNIGAIIHYHVGKNQIKKESIIDSFLGFPQPIENLEILQKTSKDIGSRTYNFGARRGT